MRRKDWADDWCDALEQEHYDAGGDEQLLLARVRTALLAAYAAGKRGESLDCVELPQ